MNPNRDPDRTVLAWLDLMPDEAPDRALAAVRQAVETTPQVRRDLVPAMRRFFLMNRVTYAAAAAIIVAVLAGGAFLLRPSASNGSPASPSPASLPTASVAPSAAAAAAPAALRATWVADGGAAAASGASSLLRLVVSPAGTRVSVLDGGVSTFASNAAPGPSNELDIISSEAVGGCQVGDVGRYAATLAADGAFAGSDGTILQLSVVTDPCTARATALARTWIRAIDTTNSGGRGISTAFAPMFLITLPAASYGADAGTDSLTLTSTSPDRMLLAVKNPIGWAEPCSTGGTKLPIAPTIKAFTAYMKTLPGFTVQSTALQIDGHPAAHLIVPSVQTADCASHRVSEWTAATDTGSGSWQLNQGDTDVLYLVEVDGNLILLQWLGSDVTAAEEQALFATLHFTDTVPTS